jgi:hypothetical protein
VLVIRKKRIDVVTSSDGRIFETGFMLYFFGGATWKGETVQNSIADLVGPAMLCVRLILREKYRALSAIPSR